MVPPVVHSLLFLAATLSSVAAHPHGPHVHQSIRSALPGAWYQPRDHPVHNLFKRGNDGVNYPAVGSPEWAAAFPAPGEKMSETGEGYPQAWIDALNAAVKAGKIPDVPISSNPDNGNPVYPKGFDPLSPTVCSSTYKCRNQEDLWDAPDGVFASSFDDGPLPDGAQLYQFLKDNNVISTHFMIGTNIVNNPDDFKLAYDELQSDIAVHTWTHPYLTTLNNLQVLGELAWTMDIIQQSTGGRIPKYIRPPFGDSDERVRAIAKEVLGLTTVIWNQDTEDWSVGQPGGHTIDQVNSDLNKWITGSKSPGLIILEHELNNNTIGAFMRAFPLIAQNGWKFESLARIEDGPVYQNAADSTGDVTLGTIGVVGGPEPTPSSDTSKPASNTGAPTSSGANSGKENNANPTSSSPSAQQSNQGASGENGALSSFRSSSSLVSLVASVVAAIAFS